jgi:hypothetical protein
LQDGEFGGFLDTLRDDLSGDIAGERYEGAGERALCPALVDSANEGYIKFDDVGLERNEVTKPGIARAEVIGGQLRPVIAHFLKGAVYSGIVLNRDVFGEFNDDPGA